MIRVLLMIAAAGFVLSVGAISAAIAIGGPEAVAHGGWKIASNHWDSDNDWHWENDGDRTSRNWGAETTRTLPWSGSTSLDLDLAADVRYIQQAGPATVTVTGPARLVDHVIVRGDTIKYENRGHHTHRNKLTIVIRAPDISSFQLSGSNALAIENYKQPRLRIDASGSADISAQGETDQVELDLSGNGDAQLGELKTKGADIDISGSADATLAPTEWASVDISGSGDLRLLTRPERLETDISGSGRIRQIEQAPAASPSASPSPTPSPSPSPKGART